MSLLWSLGVVMVTVVKRFYENIANVKNPNEFLEAAIHTPRLETVPDQWTSQILARILVHHHIIFVSDLVDPELITSMHMEIAKTFDEALERAFEREASKCKSDCDSRWLVCHCRIMILEKSGIRSVVLCNRKKF